MTSKYKYRLLVKIHLFVPMLFISLLSMGQTDTEFWLSAPEINRYHFDGSVPPGNKGYPIFIRLTTFDKAANVTISMPANAANFTPITRTIDPYKTEKIDLMPYLGDDQPGINEFTSMENRLCWTTSDLGAANPYINRNNKGILIESDNKITAYYEIGAPYNMDLLSLKGKNALGIKFFVPFQNSLNADAAPGDRYDLTRKPYNSIDIVATADNTKILITNNNRPIFIHTNSVSGTSKAAGTHEIWLNRGETAIIAPYRDPAPKTHEYKTDYIAANRLTGTLVEVDQTVGSKAPIAIISRDDMVRSSTGNVDVVADQIVPIDLIGLDYAVVRGLGSNAEEFAYVVGTADATTFRVNDLTNYVVNARGTVAVPIPNTQPITTIKSLDPLKPVYVYHMSGAGAQKAGALIPTISNCTGSRRVAFNRTKGLWGGYTYDFYLTILVWHTGVGKFKLTKNGVDVTASLPALNVVGNFLPLPQAGTPYSNWRYARIPANVLTAGDDEAYTLENEENVFHLGVLNGTTNADCFYGYFSNFNQVEAIGTVGPSINPEISLCYGTSTQLDADGGAKFSWSPITFLDNPLIANPNVVFPTVTTKYTVTVSGACDLTSSADVTVNVSNVIPSFTADTLHGCDTLTVKFKNTSVGDIKRLTWYWKKSTDPGSGAVFRNVLITPTSPPSAHEASHKFSNTTSSPITYIVNLKIQSTSCIKVISKNIVVYPKVKVAPSVIPNNGCQPLNAQFSANATGATGTCTFNWEFGDGGSALLANPLHTYNNLSNTSKAFIAMVKLTDQWNVCKDSSTVNVLVQPFIKASFVINKIEGCSPLDVTIDNDSRGGIDEYYWDRDGDGSDDYTGEGSGTFTFNNPTITNDVLNIPIRLRVKNSFGCSDQITRIIKVFPQAQINTFDLDNHGNGLGCSPLNMDFTATTTNATIYHWLIDGNAFNNTKTATYTFDNFGAAAVNKTATFTANNQYGCLTTQTQPITVQPFVDAQFVADNEVGCSPLGVNLVNASSLGSSLFSWYIDGALYATTTNIPAQSFNNPTITNVPRIIPIRLEARNAAGCTDNLTKNITVNPLATASFTYTDAGNLNHCSPFSTTFTSSVTNTNTYQWEFGTFGASNVANPSFNFNIDGTIPVTLTVNNVTNCLATTTQNIVVRPGVKALFSIDKTANCPPYDATVSAVTSAAITNYTWNFNGVPFTGANQIFSNPSNLTGVDITKNITLTVGNGFCSDATSKTIVVYPQVDAQYTASKLSGCSPLTVDFASQSALYGTLTPVSNIVWDFKDNSTAITTPVTHTFINPDHTVPQVFNVTLTATSNKGCTETETIPITVNPTVNAAFNTLITQPCTPVRVNVKDVSFAGPTISTFTWSYPSGTLVPPEDKDFDIDFDNIDPVNPVNRAITLNISNTYGCTSSKTQNFVIDPKVNVALALTAPVDGGGTPIDRLCAPAKFTFSNNSTGVNLTYTWDFKDGVTQTTNTTASFDHTFENRTAATKQFDVQLSAVNLKGCSGTASRSVWVYPEVDAKFSMTRDSSCTPFFIKLKDESLNGTQWSWDFGHTILGVPQTRTSIVPGETFTKLIDNETVTDQIKNYKIKLTLDDIVTGCKDTISQMLEVYPRVITNFTVTPISGCSPTMVTFTNSSSGLGSYLWELDNGLSFTQVVPVPLSISNSSTVNEKIVNVKLTSTNILGCKSNLSRTITIAPTVKASFTSSILEGCDPFTANFTNLTPSTAYNYSWSVNGTPQVVTQDYSRNFTNLSNPPVINKYKILLESSYKMNATCKDTLSKIITVYPRVYPNFTLSNVAGCHPLTTDLTNTTVAYNNTAAYSWNLANGTYSNLKDLTNQLYKNNTPTKDTTYFIKLFSRSIHQCVDSITKTITVYPKPIASYVMGNESVSCSPFLVTLTNLSIGQGSPSYSFDLDDGTIINTLDKSLVINHSYRNKTAANKDYTITLTTTTANGCSHSTSQTVYAYPEVTSRFSLSETSGCSPLMVNFTGTSNNGYFYQWLFRDGTNSNLMSPNHRFVNIQEKDTTFNVLLKTISAYNCEDDTIVPVTVYATPVANFGINPPLKIFPDATFNFSNQSAPAADAWMYTWDFGDGFTSNLKNPGDHTYLKWGPNNNDNIYSVMLKVDAPHCSSTTTNILRLLPTVPIPFFNSEIDKSCSPLEVHFVNASQYGKNYFWEFGDGTSSSEVEPIKTFIDPGYYVVKLKVDGDGGTSYYYKTYRVYQNPIAGFKAFPNRVMLPDAEVHLYNTTQFGHSYVWQFGDGTESTEKDPVHLYKELGEFRVTLTAWAHDTLGTCKDEISVYPAVWVEGVGKVDFPNAFVPNKNGSNGGVYDDVDYKNEVFHPVHDGVSEYKLMIFNRWGEQLFESTNTKVGWDGYYNGKLCDQGVYIWRAIGKFTNGKSFDKKGNVTLLR